MTRLIISLKEGDIVLTTKGMGKINAVTFYNDGIGKYIVYDVETQMGKYLLEFNEIII